MNTPNATSQDLKKVMNELGRRARLAARHLATASNDRKSQAISEAAKQILNDESAILKANAEDVAVGMSAKRSEAMLDRLRLDNSRLNAIANSLDLIAELPDPVGQSIAAWKRPNGLKIERVRTPLGVIGVIYESRPNVTADAGALCLKSGNAVILRGGSDSWHSSNAIHRSLVAGLKRAGLPEHAIQFVPTNDRSAVGEMLSGLNGNLDILVPRGGKSLVARVHNESRVPVFAHLEGVCHVYVDGEADLTMAKQIVVNSKMRRTGICGAAETLLIDDACHPDFVIELLAELHAANCEIRADERLLDLLKHQMTLDTNSLKPATESDWSTEYLDAVISVKLVGGVNQAIAHVNQFGSGHTESIVTTNDQTAAQFMGEIDSAILLHNASTQFADGGEFGMGAEIGIATGKMHARGPVGVEQLTTFNYRVHGTGQTRPD